MKILKVIRRTWIVTFLFFPYSLLIAAPRPPMWPPLPELTRVLHHESFDEVFYAGVSNAVVSIPDYGTLRASWSGYSLERVGTVTPFMISGLGETGRVQVTTDRGALRFWFRPYWNSGAGPGASVRLAELAAVEGSQAAVLWSLRVTADGTGLQLAGPGGNGVLLEAEIDWAADSWHQLVLNYGTNGTELVLDGEIVAKGDATLAVPASVVRLVIGSSFSGELSAGGEVDEVVCFGRPLKAAFHYLPFASIAALGPMSEAELAYRQELMEKWQASKTEKAKETEESGGGMQMLRLSGPSTDCITNGPVYLTNVIANFTTNDGWTVYFDIAGGTNGVVYDIFSTTEFFGNDVTNSVWTWLETGMTCETHWFTNQPTNQVFYILTVPGADRDGDGLYDGWEWKHFGTLEQPPDGDYDGDEVTNLEEFQNSLDPNSIMCVVRSETDYVNSNSVPILLETLHGVPYKMGVLVNSTNFDNAVWSTFNSNLLVYLGTQDGKYDVWIAVSNRTSLQASGWERHTFYRDTVPPLVVVENPINTTPRPLIQIGGYCPELIGSLLSYDVFNADGDLTNQMAYVKNQFFDTNLMTVTTNWWQCYDVRLAVGTNTIVVRAFDKAGNGGVATNVVVFDVSSDTSPPAMELHWPQNGDLICGTSFTLRGWLDDPTARVVASVGPI